MPAFLFWDLYLISFHLYALLFCGGVMVKGLEEKELFGLNRKKKIITIYLGFQCMIFK